MDHDSPAGAGAGADYRLHRFDDVTLQSGVRLPAVSLAYRSWGELAPARDNFVLFPTWFGSTHRNNEWLIGPGRALDPARYFIVSINLLGNGLSSSPSNTPVPFDRRRFPSISMLDNVRLQARLLDEVFGVDLPALVIGRSMGAQFAFQWGSYLPERTRRLFCLCGSARTTPHNRVFLDGIKAALTADCAWRDGEYAAPPIKGLQAVGRLYAGWAMSPDFYRQQLYRREGCDDVDDYVAARWRDNFIARDANDLLSMIATWQSFDPSHNERYRGDWQAAMAAIDCPAIVMPSRTDLYFPPEDSAVAVAAMPRAELRVIESAWGHRAGSPNSDPADVDFVDRAIGELLSA
ncbi:MAG: alpha/beta fold hydrolase [Burkholderiaceae bacterium]